MESVGKLVAAGGTLDRWTRNMATPGTMESRASTTSFVPAATTSRLPPTSCERRLAQFSKPAPTTGARVVLERDYLSAAVGWLDQHHCHIAEILTDRWSLVRVVERRWNPDGKDIETTLELRIQCDRVEDGVALAVQFIAQRSSS